MASSVVPGGGVSWRPDYLNHRGPTTHNVKFEFDKVGAPATLTFEPRMTGEPITFKYEGRFETRPDGSYSFKQGPSNV